MLLNSLERFSEQSSDLFSEPIKALEHELDITKGETVEGNFAVLKADNVPKITKVSYDITINDSKQIKVDPETSLNNPDNLPEDTFDLLFVSIKDLVHKLRTTEGGTVEGNLPVLKADDVPKITKDSYDYITEELKQLNRVSDAHKADKLITWNLGLLIPSHNM